MRKFYTVIIIFFLLQITNYSQMKRLDATRLDYNITVTSPKEGDSLKVGTTKFILWKTNYSNYSKPFLLEYSTNNGSTWQIIDYIDEYVHAFDWIVPNTPSNYCIVRITQDSIKGYSRLFSIFGKLQWEEQNCSFTQQLNSVFFVDSSIGWIAGYDGLLKTTNGGENWYSQSIPANTVLFDVFFIDSNIGWFVGNGIIYKTIDGGENWNPQTTPYSDPVYHYFKIQFFDTQNGYILGEDAVLKTTNGGQLWFVPIQGPPIGHILHSMFFINKDTGWIGGNEAVLLKTTDGGLDWIYQQTSGSIYSAFRSIFFIDKNTGWASGSGAILKTTDGGNNWNLQLNNNDFNSIYFNNYLEGWAVGNVGKMLSTQDGGTTWIEEGSGVGIDLLSVYFLSLTEGWAVGKSGKILKYKFIDWQLKKPLFEIPINIRNDNGGKITVLIGIDSSATDSLDYILGEDGLSTLPPPSVFDARLNLPNSDLSSFKDIRYGPEADQFEKVYQVQYQRGEGTEIVLSWDLPDGLTLRVQDIVTGSVIDQTFGAGIDSIVVTNPDAIDKLKLTVTYPSNYTPVELTSLKGEVLNEVIELKWKTATETNNKGFEVERKLNSGWEKIGYIDGHGTTTIPTEYNYTDNFKYQSYGGIVSYRLKQIDLDGSYHYSEEIKLSIDFTPKEFTLYQNFPNPFNPSTTIKYAIPFESSVDIKIYNITGQKIEEFKEGIKEAGYHNVNWQPKNLSSGVYFYSIVAKSTDGKNDYSKTLKMLYMK